jgi:hypothetical protein
MTAINKNNYEVFFLDHIEGRLDATQTAALMLFLDAHPELKEELEGLEMVSLEPDNQISFTAKDSLKKPLLVAVGKINEHNYEEFFVAGAEGDLSKSDMLALSSFLEKNPGLMKDYENIRQCRLQPDKQVVFANKALLKKTILVPFFTQRIYYGVAIAASLGLLIGLAILFEPGVERPEEITRIEPLPVQKKIGVEPAIPGEPDISVKPGTIRPEVIGQDSESLASLPQPAQDNEVMEIEKIIPKTREHRMPVVLASLLAPATLQEIRLPKLSQDQRLYFSNYFNDIAMAQHIRHAESLEEEQIAERLFAQGTAVVKEIFQPGDQEIQILPGQVNLWNIADAGINGFARITGADLEFRKKKNDEGKVTAFALESQSMLISRNLRRNK